MDASSRGVAGVVGAGEAVVAGAGDVGVHAAAGPIAAICGADIAVIATDHSPTSTATGGTGVTGCTRISVVTRGSVVRIDATTGRITRVIRTNVPVIAIRSDSPATRAAGATICGRTGITIITIRTVRRIATPRS